MLAAHFQVHAPNHRARFFFCPVQCRRTRTLGSGIVIVTRREEGGKRRSPTAVAAWAVIGEVSERGNDIVVPFDNGLLQILRREIC